MKSLLYSRRAVQLATLLGLLQAGSVWAQAQSHGVCQLQASQQEKNWPFEIEVVTTMPSWSANRTAAELYTIQNKFVADRASPYAKSKIPPELGFYQANISLTISPYVTYTETIDGRKCAQVVGAKLTVAQAPEIFLPKELAARNCVSRAALEHQLRHHAVAVALMQEVASSKDEVKSEIFPTYQKQGAAGQTPDQIARVLKDMERASTATLQAKLAKLMLQDRKQKVITQEIFGQLYASCSGEFEKASALAQPTSGH